MLRARRKSHGTSHGTSHRMVYWGRNIARHGRLGDRRARAQYETGIYRGQQAGERRTGQTEAGVRWMDKCSGRTARLVMAMGSKDGRTEAFVVDAFTGRLRSDRDDDDD